MVMSATCQGFRLLTWPAALRILPARIPNMFPANSSGKGPVKLAPPVLSSTQPTPPSIPLLASILQRATASSEQSAH
ncbi:spindle poison sensitivity protein Scp3 [Histoplasma capsulatum]|uniref:Spindle poison sensitivity protein Scp3 n=1 Tax=Ajellomyces capsulatus TaxID=5037 RepID=A0A8A1M849_AJECA|nr:spindle poison sensitivity protein Scp3 [Histoplasma capsulatum]